MILSFIASLFTAPLDIVYSVKWIISYVAIRIYNAYHKNRFDLYDIRATGDPIKLGFLIPQLEKDLESPLPESELQKTADEVFFYGVNSKSECLLVRITRGPNQDADAWIYLRLANGKTYRLSETSGFQQPFEGKCLNFSCGKLQMQYLSPMRRWRIFYCGMLKETSPNSDSEKSLFVKFVFLWKASSDIYDLSMDTNPEGIAAAFARANWRNPFVPPVNDFAEGVNFYSQAGILDGTVSVDEDEDYEMYLFGEKMRNVGKSANIAGCKFTHVMGNIPHNGYSFHLGQATTPNIFHSLPFGFIVDSSGAVSVVKDVEISIIPSSRVESKNNINVCGSTSGNKYEITGTSQNEPVILYSGQGWSGYVEVSFIKFKMGGREGSGIIMTGEVYKEPIKTPAESISILQFPESVPLTVQFSEDICSFGEISGGKGSSLGKLTQLSHKNQTFTVPKGIVVTTGAYEEFLTTEIKNAVKHLENIAYGNVEGDVKVACNLVSGIVEKTLLSHKICHSIIEDLKDIFGDEINSKKFAVRSSATGEDTSAMSAAGQMDTFLGVQGLKEIFMAVKKCWASQFGFIAVEYKRRNGQILNSPMAVVIQEMVACEVSGVLFTCDPVTNNPSFITITANYGLGETVVSGSVEPDTISLRRKHNGKLKVESVTVGTKHQKIVMQESGGTITEDLPENSKDESCLSEEMAIRLGKLSIEIEKFYKSSRDIEWGIRDGTIYMLQSRPVTNIAGETDYEISHEFDAPLRCDVEFLTVANIGEVMPGATSPLGMDVILKVFTAVMRRHALENGQLDNILQSKYFLSGIIPFYNHMMMTVIDLINRFGTDTDMAKGFMISIFGRILDDPEMLGIARERGGPPPPQSQMVELKFYWQSFFDKSETPEVKERLDNYEKKYLNKKTSAEAFQALMDACSDFDKAVTQLMINTETSSKWNMHLFQILCAAKGSVDTDVYSDFARLLAASSSTSVSVESVDVPQAMQDLAIQIQKDISSEAFKSMTVEDAERWLQSHSSSTSGEKFRQFLKRHGHRCLKEFDVKSITWAMNPKLLVRILQNLVGTCADDKKKEEDSYDKIFSELNVPLGFWHRLKLKFVLPNCRRGIGAREAGKSVAIQAFDCVRQGYRHIARLMVSEGRIPDEDLLFFLNVSEIEELLKTRSPGLISRANYRRKLYPILEEYKFPEIMRGAPKPVNESTETYEFTADLTMKGIPVSQGVTKGFARVAMTLEEASHLQPGEILITYCTDIGWTPYFPVISGVVTELGGLISHGAVVSREYGLPCVVGLQGATKKFKTGDYVLLDGKKGILQRLPEPQLG